jgi:hypothetical protein
MAASNAIAIFNLSAIDFTNSTACVGVVKIINDENRDIALIRQSDYARDPIDKGVTNDR